QCHDENEKDEPKLTNAARRYVFSLAALAEGHPRAAGSHRLRSGCELLAERDGLSVEVRGGDGNSPDSAALKRLFTNRPLLPAVAEEGKGILKIPESLPDFVVSKESLKGDFDGVPSQTPVEGPAGSQQKPEPKSRRPRANK